MKTYNSATGSNELRSLVPPVYTALYERLAARYGLGVEEVVIRGRHFRFVCVRDLEPLLSGKDLFASVSDFPFWVKIWDASIALADMVARLPLKPGLRALEIGAGLGITGVVAAAFGCNVTITDIEEDILDFSRLSAAINGCEMVSHAKLDWLSPSQSLKPFDMILGSEVLFNERFFLPLLTVFKQLLAPGGVIYLAHGAERKSLAQFLPLCSGDYEIALQQRILSAGDDRSKIVLTRLKPKQ
jgi:2-polyprenyl-3-methyl-5-hydroxy-6-metoxy-1,4-benzoquinol methylase